MKHGLRVQKQPGGIKHPLLFPEKNIYNNTKSLIQDENP